MKYLFFYFTLAVFYFAGCTPQKNNAVAIENLHHQMVERLTTVIVHDIFSPPVASRIYAYCNLAWYEAIRFAEPDKKSITASLKGFATMPVPKQPVVLNYELAALHAFGTTASALLFSKDSMATTINQLYSLYKAALIEEVFNNSIALGDSIAAVILGRAAEDNYKRTRSMPKYSVFGTAGKWQQTPPDYADAAEPYWGTIKPLLLDSANQFAPAPPPPFSLATSSQYYQELMEVVDVSNNITATQDSIAHYWDDNPFVTEHKGHFTYATKKTTPVGHWMGITAIACRQKKLSVVNTAAIYALTSASIFDGFISCWHEKYRSATVRPITVIRAQINPNWNALLQTPAFPEYTSGHSVISGVASTLLEKLLGSQLAFTDTTELAYLGMQRSFPSIKAAAEEACISRLYGGIHFRAAIEEGKKQGIAIGNHYNKIFFNGR
jgi:hypothetical protein